MAPDFTSPEVAKLTGLSSLQLSRCQSAMPALNAQKLIQIANKQVLGHATIADVEKRT
ncbi:hypothetical protein [Citrobacter portucalensis]|uniref:hypothetical protein n=1 Tax=Citrobacter portucalensis TaxID=1639133 RepID=UPI00388CF516